MRCLLSRDSRHPAPSLAAPFQTTQFDGSRPPSDSFEALETPAIGLHIDHFRVRRQIGQGGMGRVLLARLSHPNIVTIHHIGRWGKSPYLALEYAAGTSLRDTGDPWFHTSPVKEFRDGASPYGVLALAEVQSLEELPEIEKAEHRLERLVHERETINSRL